MRAWIQAALGFKTFAAGCVSAQVVVPSATAGNVQRSQHLCFNDAKTRLVKALKLVSPTRICRGVVKCRMKRPLPQLFHGSAPARGSGGSSPSK